MPTPRETIIARAFVQSWDQHIGLDGAKAVMDAIESAGLVIVPKVPSPEMRAAANRLNHPRDEEIYAAMIEAAK